MQVETRQDEDQFAPEGHEQEGPCKPLQSLTELFPNDNRNLDDLFPEAKFRELFKDVAAGLADVDNFVRRIDLELTSEKRSGPSKTRPVPRTTRRQTPPRSGAKPGAVPWKRT
jgi:hypothetical protein